MSDDLVQQLAAAMRADVNDGHWTGWEQTARAVLASGLVIPASDVLNLAGHFADPVEHADDGQAAELRALTQQEPR